MKDTLDKIPQNAVTLLRICTKKSIVQFGKYAGCTVGDVLKIDVSYVAYLYYSVPNFSLHADIIGELSLLPIPKPGTDAEKFALWRKQYSASFTEEERQHGSYLFVTRSKRRKVARLAAARRAEHYSKAKLQALNHGHGLK